MSLDGAAYSFWLQCWRGGASCDVSQFERAAPCPDGLQLWRREDAVSSAAVQRARGHSSRWSSSRAIAIMGAMPFIAPLLAARDGGGPAQAGIALAGFALVD
jgi:hypothetical protein